ncbi:unnamed protein product [Darwinula stevensoni]|uniref:Serine aminopeptidase S33 domain-containing protein n=1 Tax=Darwinula stevensoni TaxID=69355 RepID=A0A7R8X2L1_9CRUS|nr:unnamed protein product [Darwinula stevensoni]CAG0881332.1 unnamed protein product [Darwinula stevensoni]
MIKRIAFFGLGFVLWLQGVACLVLLKSYIVIIIFLYVFLPLLFHYCECVKTHLIFLPFVRWPRNIDFRRPERLELNGTRNFYLQTEDNISLGVWHILPLSMVEKGDKSENEYIESLQSSHRIVIYMHGNTASRAGPHRVELYKVLRALDYHIITFDYRGYADSTWQQPSEDGVVSDAKAVYRWVASHAGETPIFIWGHSLGTGLLKLKTNFLSTGESFRGLILESPFNNMKDELRNHPMASIYRKMPFFDWLFLGGLSKSRLEFESSRHILKVNVPVLILHAEDDLVVPYILGVKLYEHAKKNRPREYPPLMFVKFDSELGHGHRYICRSPHLPSIIRSGFMQGTVF